MNSAKKNYNRYNTYIILLIVSLVFGNLGGALMIVRILGVLFLPILLVKYKYCLDYVKSYFFFFSAFYLFCIISLLWTPNFEQASKELFYYPAHFLLFFEILVFSRYAIDPLKTISWSWIIAVGLTLIIAMWEILTNNHLSLSKFQDGDIALNLDGFRIERPFAAVTFGNYNGYVTYLCFAMPFLFYNILLKKKNSTKSLIALFVIFVTTFVLLINASRGGLISFLIIVAVFLCFSKINYNKSIFLIIGSLLFIYFFLPRLDTLFIGLYYKTYGDNLYTDNTRINLWGIALDVLKKYFFIGTGIGGLTTAMNAEAHSQKLATHSMFFEMLVQYGVSFFSLFIIYIAQIFKRALSTSNRSVKIMLFMAIFEMPICCIIDSGYLLNPIVYIVFGCLTVFAYNERINRSNYIKDNCFYAQKRHNY